MSYTREQWCQALLAAIGNTEPTQNTLEWVSAWTSFETQAGTGASYNLLNTTQFEPGCTNFNSVPVRNYVSFEQGILANKTALENGFYPDLLAALQTNNEAALGFGAPTSNVVLKDLSIWCGGCGYGENFHEIMGQGLQDTFTGVDTVITPNYQLQQFNDVWNASGLPSNTGIHEACWKALSDHNIYFGMPTHAEIITTDWQGNKIALQTGSQGLRVEWHYSNNSAHFYTATNTQVLSI